MAHGLPNGHVTDDVTWPWKVKLVTPICLERNISKTTWARDFKFGMQLCIGNAERCTNNFPESGRGLGHVTPTIFGIRSNISRKILEVETSNLIHDIVWGITSGRTKNFPAKWAWPASRDPTIIGIRSKISRKLFQLVTSNLVRSFDCRVLHTVVYCGAVRSAILATAWLLVVT